MKAKLLHPTLNASVHLILTEEEAIALKAIAGYGAANFVRVFCSILGKSHLKTYEQVIAELFKNINTIDTQLEKINKARQIFNADYEELMGKKQSNPPPPDISKKPSPPPAPPSKKENNIIRVNDQVKIIHPYVFVRCGYPKTLDSVKDKVEKKYSDKIINFIKSLNFIPSHDAYTKYQFFDDICKVIQYRYLRDTNFGGNTRKVYTKYDFHIKNGIGIVKKIEYVKTGIYTNYYDGDEYESWVSNYLEHQKTIKLLTVEIHDINNKHYFYSRMMLVKIPSLFVEKLK